MVRWTWDVHRAAARAWFVGHVAASAADEAIEAAAVEFRTNIRKLIAVRAILQSHFDRRIPTLPGSPESQSSPACGGLLPRSAGLAFLPPPPGLQPGVTHRASATCVPVFTVFAVKSSPRPIFALAEIVPVTSMTAAASTPHNFKKVLMTRSSAFERPISSVA
jgi:hypothetical protein